MALPITIPNTFANATTSIPLSQLDNNFSTVVVAINGIGNGAEALANVNITGGRALNVTFSSSNVNITGGSVNVSSVISTGNVSDQSGLVRIVPAAGAKNTSYTLQKSDVGKFVEVTSGGSITIPNDVFAGGDVVSLFNNTTANCNVTCSITTAYLSGIDSDKASVVIPTRGVATVLFISNASCVIAGNAS